MKIRMRGLRGIGRRGIIVRMGTKRSGRCGVLRERLGEWSGVPDRMGARWFVDVFQLCGFVYVNSFESRPFIA